MSLTDDWKAGRLKNGWYYVQCKNDEIAPDLWMDDEWSAFSIEVVEVLSPCDYEELQRLRKLTAKLLENGDRAFEIIQQRCKEIEQLRQLLKESKNALEWYAQCKCSKSMIDKEGIIFEFADKANKALTRINEVLK